MRLPAVIALLIASPAFGAVPSSTEPCLWLTDEARRASIYRDVGLDLDFFKAELIAEARLPQDRVDTALSIAAEIFAGAQDMQQAFDLALAFCQSGNTRGS